jgi:hypothetical protein
MAQKKPAFVSIFSVFWAFCNTCHHARNIHTTTRIFGGIVLQHMSIFNAHSSRNLAIVYDARLLLTKSCNHMHTLLGIPISFQCTHFQVPCKSHILTIFACTQHAYLENFYCTSNTALGHSKIKNTCLCNVVGSK